MFAPSIPGRVCPNAQSAHARGFHNSQRSTMNSQRYRAAFTLFELLIVMAVIAILMVLIAPAFTTIKGGINVTSAANTVKSVLDTARTYAKANNTYTWVGFYEEDVSQSSTTPATSGVGRLVMSVVTSKDGTNVATSGTITPTTLVQVGKLTKIDNVHLVAFPDGSGQPPGSTFDTRPPVTFGTQYSLAGMANSATTIFPYPLAGTSQYPFKKAVQFSSDGEAQIIGSSVNAVQTAAEIGLEPTHGNVVPNPTPANLVAIQFGGVGAGVIIYRK
jgi:prepilin-type N-terminal cleavage/methylation domain-containing protein